MAEKRGVVLYSKGSYTWDFTVLQQDEFVTNPGMFSRACTAPTLPCGQWFVASTEKQEVRFLHYQSPKLTPARFPRLPIRRFGCLLLLLAMMSMFSYISNCVHTTVIQKLQRMSLSFRQTHQQE